jgi:Zn-dependent protease
MHEQRPSDVEGEYLPPDAPPPPKPQSKIPWKTIGGTVGAGWIWWAKLKTALLLLANFKVLLLLPKFFALFLSIWFYALFFGWKFGIVFVLLILVHELGHYVTFRNFGIQADLPFFIPGFGAFVAPRGPQFSLTIEALAALAGPVYGLLASGLCYYVGVTTHDPFWIACAYTGCLINAINLLPVPPLDGGHIAAAIDPRLWIVGAVAFLGFIVFFHIWAGLLFVLLIGIVAVPRIRAMLAGYVDPRFSAVPRFSRIAIAAAYFITAAIAAGGAFATYFDPRAHL